MPALFLLVASAAYAPTPGALLPLILILIGIGVFADVHRDWTCTPSDEVELVWSLETKEVDSVPAIAPYVCRISCDATCNDRC